MRLAQAAQAIAEGKVKATVADLDRLIRLEEFLREEGEKQQLKVVMCWSDGDGKESEDQEESDQ